MFKIPWGRVAAAALCVAGAASWGQPAGGGNLLHPTRAPVRCGIPIYDYQPRSTSLPLPATTFSSIELRVREIAPVTMYDADGVPRVVRMKTFALSEPALAINHCAIRNVNVQVTEDGFWTIALEAVQDPFVGPTHAAQPEVRFKRNRFYVTARGLGNFKVHERSLDIKVAKPELFRLYVPPFWVERNDVESVAASGRLPARQARDFEALDRFEILFRYE